MQVSLGRGPGTLTLVGHGFYCRYPIIGADKHRVANNVRDA